MDQGRGDFRRTSDVQSTFRRRPGAKAVTLAGAFVLVGCAGVTPPSVSPSLQHRVDSETTAAQVESPRPGLLVMAHGGSEAWNASVTSAVQPLMAEVPTAIAFGMAKPETLESAVRELEAQGVDRIAVVRLFVSGDSFLHQTEYLFGARTDAPVGWPMRPSEAPTPQPIATSAAVDIDLEGLIDADETGDILRRRVMALSSDPGSEAVLVLGHGNGDPAVNDRLLDRMEARSEGIRSAGFREVKVATLREDWAEARKVSEKRIRAWVQARADEGLTVLVVPLRLSGFGPYAEVLGGLTYTADGRGLLPDEAISQWLRRRSTAVFCANRWQPEAVDCSAARAAAAEADDPRRR